MAERKRREAGLPPGGGPGLAETQAGPPSAALSCPRCFAAVPAAARFCAFCGNPVARAEAEAGERRPLIVLFCDMVGSAKLSTELDPEDLTELIRDFQRRVAGVIAAYGGCVARRLGDGALVYFGYPSAAEDDAERAVRAALAVTEAMASIPAGPGHAVQVRIGLATGIAVIGDVSGTGAADALEIAGEAPNLAARLQALAEPGTVVVSDTVRNQLGGLFLWRDLGPHKLKGWTEAVRAWQPVAPARDVTRFEARQPAAPIPLIGRDAPATRLAALWREARAGAGRVVLISGEAGIGKSRLVANLLETTAGDRHARLRFSASPHQRDTPLHPVLQAIERFAGFAPGDDTDLRRRKLRAALAATPERDLALIAGLLMLPMPEQPKLAQLAPQRRRALVLQALLGLSVRLARARPILEVFEDAHWADPTSVELLGLTPRAFAGLPILMV
ncbi:MAG TPA: AAA family ATPase, partial [Crenalkalicoccus sp.]|nr:AAA family ATPase [Crenalkalicoccus sp.]